MAVLTQFHLEYFRRSLQTLAAGLEQTDAIPALPAKPAAVNPGPEAQAKPLTTEPDARPLTVVPDAQPQPVATVPVQKQDSSIDSVVSIPAKTSASAFFNALPWDKAPAESQTMPARPASLHIPAGSEVRATSPSSIVTDGDNIILNATENALQSARKAAESKQTKQISSQAFFKSLPWEKNANQSATI